VPVPTQIKLHTRSCRLEIRFEDGLQCRLPFGYLRSHSPAAGEHPQDAGDVRVTAIEPVGNYAVRLVFSDGHDSGLYTWDTLYRLAKAFSAPQDSL